MRQILIITRAFPPLGGGGVQRMIKFATYLKDHGWNATVVAPNKEKSAGWHDESPLKLVRPEQIIRVGDISTTRSRTMRLLRKAYPIDACYPWARQVVRHLDHFPKVSPDVVLTSGPPHSVHRVGYLLSKHRGTAWVADFRDHFTLGPEYSPATPVHQWLDRRFEKTILDHSNVVICNTRTNRRELLAEFGYRYAGKTATIYNGFDRDDLDINTAGQDVTQFANHRTHYLYLGGLRGGQIDDSFFRVIDRACKINADATCQIAIHVVGDSSRRTELTDRLIQQGVVTLQPPVPAASLGKVIAAADACVTWQRDSIRYRGTIAGKLFDYLAMEKPVFALGQINGEVDRLLRRFGLGICVPPADVDEAARRFLQFHHALRENRFQLRANTRCSLDRYSRQFQTAQLARVLNKIVEQPS